MRSTSPFRALWGANALSNLADGLVFVTMPLVAAGLTDDPRGVAGLATTYALVRLLVALPVGVYVDRLDRRTLIVVADALRGVAVLGLAVSIQSGVASLSVLYAVMAVVGVLESAADGAAVAVLPSIVPAGRLDRANARITGTQLVADEFVGPPLGGILFALAAAVPVYATGGLWVAAGAVALALPRRTRDVPPSSEAPGAPPSVFREAAEGVRWLAGHRVVGSLALIGGLASVGYMLPFSVLVLFVDQRLGLDAAGYGVLLAVSALGGLAGSAIAAPLRARLGSCWTIMAALVLGARSLAALAVTRDPIVAGILLALYILHAVVWSICATSLRQRLVPGDLLGRVGSAGRVVSLVGLAAGSALGGVLATVGIALPTIAGAVVFTGCAVLAVVALRGAGEATS
ncbi:MFS transporter [Clavibacter sepedonicus]|uniref:Integral membrane efflux protein n=1 Tax=Clavibacter sepedonicus TaxID=31964 RepID=B0RGH9_CLASE|nr:MULTISPECIES: MFS transporter [Clavibacter]MBD5380959.1 MFS transporter [Clavibacter sp.]OQJ46974.1 MFS transporter [Clavibacter sepedonicus]OQJ55160.1 MFS transporter [Clavibacter sepedonicus]UUK66505.1 MFS transporter [Clavibacter sepedonicus]CAQ01237.1 putative integral membrane efflux protein [Clavibacter sepedonicus]